MSELGTILGMTVGIFLILVTVIPFLVFLYVKVAVTSYLQVKKEFSEKLDGKKRTS